MSSRSVLLLALAATCAIGLFILALGPGAPGPAAEDAAIAFDEPARPDPRMDGVRPPVVRVAEEDAAGEVAAAGPPPSFAQSLAGIEGRVLNADRTPAVDIEVELLGGNVYTLLPSSERWFEPEPVDLGFRAGATRSDREGRFRFSGIDPDGYYVLAFDHGGPRYALRLVDVQPNPGEVVDLGDFVLDPYGILTGRVVDEFDEPVAGARVRASPIPAIAWQFGLGRLRRGCAVAVQLPGEDRFLRYEIPPIVFTAMDRFLVTPETVTGPDGRFRLEGVPLGDATVIASGERFLDAVKGPIRVADGEKEIADLRLFEGEELRVRVVREGEDGERVPVRGARVLGGTPLPFYPVALVEPFGVTDADGYVIAEGRPDDDHVLVARAPDAAADAFATGVAPGDEAVIVLPSARTLVVRVRSQGGEILPRPALIVRRDDPFTREMEAGLTGGLILSPPVNISDRMRHLEDGAVEIAGLDSEPYEVLARVSGFAIGRAVADLTRGDAEVDVTLAPEHTATVQVVDAASDQPVEYALAIVGEEDTGGISATASARTDDKGVARIGGLREGVLPLRVVHPAFATAVSELRVPGPPVRIELQRGGAIAGRVTRRGAPPDESRTVGVYREGDLPRAGATGPDGRFRIGRLPEGRYELAVLPRLSQFVGDGPEAPDAEMGLMGMFMARRVSSEGGDFDDGVGVLAERTVQVVEGQETWVEIDVLRLEGAGPVGRIAGLVEIDGRPAPRVVVSARKREAWSSPRSTSTGPNGRFDIGEVEAGDLWLRVSEDGAELHRQALTLAPDDSLEVAIRFDTGTVVGEVRSAETGQPLPLAAVTLSSAPPEPASSADDAEEQAPPGEPVARVRRTTDVDEDGAFRFERVPAGRYVVEARAAGYARATSDPFEVARGVTRRIPLVLIEAVDVRGTLILEGLASEPAYLFAVLEGEKGFAGLSAVDPEDMTFEFQDVAPGSYEVMVFGDGLEYEPAPLEVPRTGLDRAVVRPAPRTP